MSQSYPMSEIREFDPVSPYFEKNPFTELRRMQDSCRAYRHKGTLMNVTSLFRASDIKPALQDWETFSSQRDPEYNKKALGDAAILIGNDPPLHTKYRNIVAPLFLPSAIHPLGPVIDQMIDRAIKECVGAGEINFVTDFACTISLGTICYVCDVPEEDWPLMFQMTQDIARADGRPVFWKEPHPEVEARIANAMTVLTDYFDDHIKARANGARDNILNHIAKQIDNPRHLAGLCILLIAAGFETTMNLMTHGLNELIKNPEQMRLLRSKPELVNNAVEEMLRCRGTIRKQDRIATRDIEIGGVEIGKGESVALWTACVGRDPELIDRPDEFDITRENTRHGAFGSGIHMCIGNVLARLEVRAAFKRLIEATSVIEETRGGDSYESLGNGVLEGAQRYSVRLIA